MPKVGEKPKMHKVEKPQNQSHLGGTDKLLSAWRVFVRDSLGATQSSLLRNTDKLSLSVPPVRAAMQLTLVTLDTSIT